MPILAQAEYPARQATSFKGRKVKAPSMNSRESNSKHFYTELYFLSSEQAGDRSSLNWNQRLVLIHSSLVATRKVATVWRELGEETSGHSAI
jgi:hypothetical protein